MNRPIMLVVLIPQSVHSVYRNAHAVADLENFVGEGGRTFAGRLQSLVT